MGSRCREAGCPSAESDIEGVRWNRSDKMSHSCGKSEVILLSRVALENAHVFERGCLKSDGGEVRGRSGQGCEDEGCSRSRSLRHQILR